MTKKLLIILSALLPTYLIRFSLFGIPTTLLEIFIYLIFVFKIYQLFQAKQKIQHTQYLYPILLLILSGLISAFIAPDKRVALGLLKAYIIDPILVSWLVIDEFGENRKYLYYSLGFSALYVSLHALYQRLTGEVTIDNRVVGLFGYSPNYLALFLSPICVLSFGFFWKKEKGIWLWFILFILTALAVFVSGSRAGLISLVAGIVFFLFLVVYQKSKKKTLLNIGAVVGIILALTVGWKYFGPDPTASPSDGRVATSNNLRLEVWKTTLEIIGQKPIFGVGLGNYQNYFTNLTQKRVNFPEYISPYALTPHNLYLNLWVNLGILGLLSFLWIVAIFFQSSWRRKDLLAIAIIFSILVYGLLDTPFWKNDLAILFWLFI